jgi:hypothetical protein
LDPMDGMEGISNGDGDQLMPYNPT